VGKNFIPLRALDSFLNNSFATKEAIVQREYISSEGIHLTTTKMNYKAGDAFV